MEGIHIVAFAEEDDPGRRLFSSSHDSQNSYNQQGSLGLGTEICP